MQVLEPKVGEVWKYVGENQQSFGEEYQVVDILPAIKKPNWDWHKGVRYMPLEPVENAPNDYTRFVEDFMGCFRYVRG